MSLLINFILTFGSFAQNSSSDWILEDGVWDDSKHWIDTENWID